MEERMTQEEEPPRIDSRNEFAEQQPETRNSQVETVVRELLHTFRTEERKQLNIDRYNKYPDDVRVRRDLVDRVLGRLEQPLDRDTLVQLLHQLGPVGGPPLGMVALQWILDQEWPDATSPAVFNALISLCDRCCHDDKTALQVYDMMKQLGIHADLLTYNLLLGFCRIKGNWQTAFQLFEEMNLKAVAPNMFTYMTLIEVSNYRGAGRCHEALYAFRALLNAGEPVPDYVEEELVRCVENGCAKTDLKGALQIFAKMEAVGMSKSTRTYNAVLAACAGAGEWVAALDIYACMVQEGVTADTASYNAVLQACATAGEVDRALDVFEWMAEGRGSDQPVVADTTTYNILINACKQKGMLEKALEVFTWMQGSGCAANDTTYESLMLAVEEAREWDDGISLGTPVEGLRPAPYDGMRCVYMEHHIERSLDERLAEIKLGEASWAPPAMRSPAAPGDRERQAAGTFEPSLYDFMEERERGPKKGFWASRGQNRGGLALSNASLSTSLLRPRSTAGGGGSGAAGASGGRSLTAEASFRPKGARLGRITPDPSLQSVHSIQTPEVNPWSPQASAYRRPPPLSAKEMVLARQHRIDTNEYRLA